MSARPRMTMVVLDILDAMISAPPDDPTWGLKLCEDTGYGTGTVFPALKRMLEAGWITDRWEEPAPADRPRRRYYSITGDGRGAYEQVVRERALRKAARVR